MRDRSEKERHGINVFSTKMNIHPYNDLSPAGRVRLLTSFVCVCGYEDIEKICRKSAYAHEWKRVAYEECGWLYHCMERPCGERCLTKALEASSWLRRLFYQHHSFLRRWCLDKHLSCTFFVVDSYYRTFCDVCIVSSKGIGLSEDVMKMCFLFLAWTRCFLTQEIFVKKFLLSMFK